MKTTLTKGLATLFLSFILLPAAFAQTVSNNRVIEVPFEFLKNEVVIQANINGHGPFNMLLDTGTDPSAVDIKTGKDIGLKMAPVGEKASGTGTDVNLAYATRLPIVTVGGVEAKNVEAAAIDLSKVSERMGRPIHVILGQSFLNNRIVQFDFPKKVVRFFERPPLSDHGRTNSAAYTRLSFHDKHNVMIGGVLVNGKAVPANIDTGSSSGFQLTPAAVSELGLGEIAKMGEVTTSVGYNGVAENHSGRLKNITIGGISVDDPGVVFFAAGSGHDKMPWMVNIGNAFMMDFVVTFDYKNKTVTFERP